MAQTTGNEEWNSENPADNSVFHEGDRGTLHKRKSARSVREEDQTSFGAAELAPLTRQGSGGRELIGDGEAGVAAAAALGLTAEGGGGGDDDGGEGAGQGEGEGGDAVGGLGGGAGGPRGVRTRDFDILCVIGMGAYGRVLQVRHKRNRKVYAMKVISKALLRKKNHISYMQAERDIMTKVDHPFVVGLKCSFQTPEKMFLIMDYMPGGELFFHLDREGFILEEVARFYVAELTLALEFLHSIHIIHRDLKPENVLIDAQGHIKVTDFGLAKDFRDGDASDEGTRTVCGTYEYMAPEMISKKGYSKAVDWWSLGTLMYEMMTGKPPFRGKNKDVLMKRILTEKIKFPPWLTGEATSLMKAFLERNVQRRLGATKSTMFKVGGTQAIKEHRFFAAVGLDWHAIEACRRPGPILPDLATGMDTSYFHEDFTQMEVPRSLSFESQASMGDLGPPDAACLDLYKGFSFIHPNWETEQQETHSYEPRVPNNPAPVPEEEAKLETSEEEGPSSESEEEEEEAEEARATAPAQRQPGNMFAGFSGASSSEASTLPSRSASHRVTRGSSLDVDGTQFHMDELATGLAKTVINEEAPTPAESEAGAEEEGEKGAAARVAGAQQPSPAAEAAAAGAAAATTAAPAPAPAPPPAGRRLTATAAPFNPYAAAAAAAAAGAGGGGAGLPLPGYPAPPLPPGYYMTPQGAVVAAGTAPPPAPYGYYPHPHPAAAAYPGGLMMGGAPAFYPPGTAPPPPGGRPAHGGGGGGPPGKKAKNKKKKNKKQPPPQEQQNGHTNPSSPAPVPEATSSKQGADDNQPPSNQTNQSCTERPTPEKDSAPKHVAFAAEVLAKGESTETNRRSIKQGQQAASSQQSRAPVGWAATAARGGGPGAGFHPPHGGWGRGRGAFPPHHRAPNGGPAPPPPSGAPPPRGGAGPPAPPPKQEDFPSLGGNDFPALGGKPGGPAPLPRAPAPQAKSWRAVVKTADGAGGGGGVGAGAGAGSMAAGWGAGPPARKQLAAAPAVDAPPAPVAGDAGVLKGDANGWKPAGRAAAGAGGGSSAWQPPAKPW